jgi:hypothetical protein
MSSDPVSAASRHFGQVRTYATTEEIDRMQHPVLGRYSNNPVPIIGSLDDRPLVVAGRSFGAHMMHNFRSVDGDGNPDRSVLGDPRAVERARENATMIDTYRGDIREIHGIVRTGGDINRYLNDPREIYRDLFGANQPTNNGATPTRFAAAEGNNTANLLDRMLEGDRTALHAAANQPAGRELNQTVVALVDREQQQLAQRAAEQQRAPEPEVRSPAVRAV